jgi:Glycosidases
MKVSPKFGTEEDLKLMLDEAHDSGIRVIFDLVPNHTGLGFQPFQNVVENGQKSEYWEWYFINEYPFTPGDPDGYECWWGVGSLPKLNTANPEVKNYLFGVVDHWLEFGFDGCRVDVPNEVVDAHNFFAEMRDIVKEGHPDAYLVGEIWGLDGSWVQGDQFDSLMNYALGKEALLPYANGSASGEETFKKLAKYFSTYGENVAGMGFSLVSSHDTGRILTDLGGGNFNDRISKIAIMRLKLLSTLLYSIPGAPVTFQGDERGILGEKEHYDAHRYPIQWNSANKDLLAHYKKLAETRQEISALTSNAIFLYTANDNLISFFRGEEKDVLVVANNGLSSAEFDLPDGLWKVVGSGEVLENTIKIPPLRAVVFERMNR